MAAPIWQKNTQETIDQTIMDFMAGEDIILDQELIHFDIQASKAHVNGLSSIKILDTDETQQLLKQLNTLQQEIEEGTFILSNQFEDGHSAIEFYLVEKLGELGKKVHTGRSRNDQVLVATRLYLKHALSQAIEHVKASVEACLFQAEKTESVPMPGYTHMQRAVPSSAGMWFAGFAEAMIDNLFSLNSTLKLIDSNPLGTAAGYGVNLPLNRELTTQELAFSRMQINPIYTQNSRGKYELAVLSTLSQCLLDIRRYCWDVSLFTTQEFDLVKLPDEMTTGSSIMPNKRNPDLIELMRASYATVQAAVIELQSILSLPSGYQRDLQLTKGPLLRAVNKALQTLHLFPRVVAGTQFNQEKLIEAIDTPMYATDFAVELSAKGIPFRDAYQQVAERYDELSSRTAQQSIEERVSPGSCNFLMLDVLKKRYLSMID
ncbi:argininosuccinate lyase [Aliikangiella sp. IMCC44359]|uniref:argininosuccinate lyase n=1 Tax=Aliikangiella sp. IMCC44359 TaxID=3459125 RepID=UPI00403B1B51